jgi:hypothetical protein
MSNDHSALIAQFRETLTQQRYSPVVNAMGARENSRDVFETIDPRRGDNLTPPPASPPRRQTQNKSGFSLILLVRIHLLAHHCVRSVSIPCWCLPIAQDCD